MKDFERVLYEALLVAYGKILAKYNAFAQATILRDVGREIIVYLNRHGFDFQEKGDTSDLAALTDLFVKNGFAEKLEVFPADRGHNYVWHNLYGRDAYKELHEVSDNPFLACPLNLCLFYIAEKHNKAMKLLEKKFDPACTVVESQYELLDKEPQQPDDLDPLVIENARLYEIAEERAASLQAEVQRRVGIQAELERQKAKLEREIEERRRAELEVERIHRQLIDASRAAGQAEVASSVLHNVGNVLNSVNISTSLVAERLQNMRSANLARVAGMLQGHAADLGTFLTDDERGRRLPHYIGQLAEHFSREQNDLQAELKTLGQHLEHIKEIVAMQQNYARAAGVQEAATFQDMVESALKIHAGAFERHGVTIERDYSEVPAALLDKHKVLQILVHLLRNAEQACASAQVPDKKVVVRIQPRGAGQVAIEVRDNGVGIASENLTRIFSHGFSTRKGGHGFGLHSAALAAQEMNGSLTAFSEGLGKGAAFSLELPVQLFRSGHAETE